MSRGSGNIPFESLVRWRLINQLIQQMYNHSGLKTVSEKCMKNENLKWKPGGALPDMSKDCMLPSCLKSFHAEVAKIILIVWQNYFSNYVIPLHYYNEKWLLKQAIMHDRIINFPKWNQIHRSTQLHQPKTLCHFVFLKLTRWNTIKTLTYEMFHWFWLSSSSYFLVCCRRPGHGGIPDGSGRFQTTNKYPVHTHSR